MIVPFNKQASGAEPQGPKVSETDLLLALGAMHNAGRFENMGAETDPEKMDALVKRFKGMRFDPSLQKQGPVDKQAIPGVTTVPDRERGGTAQRDVRVD